MKSDINKMMLERTNNIWNYKNEWKGLDKDEKLTIHTKDRMELEVSKNGGRQVYLGEQRANVSCVPCGIHA